MKFLLIAFTVVAFAAASPTRSLVTPALAGAAVVVENPVAVGPAIIEEFENPASDFEHVEPEAVSAVAASSAPLVQIIVNVNAEAILGAQPVSVSQPETKPVVRPTPVSVIDGPADVVDPELENPTPVGVIEEPAVPELPEIGAVEPVQIAEPTLPIAVVEEPDNTETLVPVIPVTLPETLN